MILSALLILSACSPTSEATPRTVTETRFIERDIPIQPRPAPVNLNDVAWTILTQQNINEFARQFESNPDAVFVVTDMNGYQNLALNMAELRRYIEQQQSLIVYYEQSITRGWQSNITYSPQTLR
jgi:hypothetical protein